MSVLTQSGRTAIAASIKQQPIHLAWGNGDDAWQDRPPVESIEQKALYKEVGRRKADDISFCVPDPQGDLVTPSGRFKRSEKPTNNLYAQFTFDYADAPGETIRELGVMVGTKIILGLPQGQRYFLPEHIEEKGILLVLEHSVPLVRTEATRETFTFVITF